MSSRTVLFLVAAVGLGACSGNPEPDLAATAFRQFQEALQRGDASACRDLVTQESAPAIAAIDWQGVQQKQPLVVVGSKRGLADFRVQVRDPNDSDRAAEFVVVREYGRMVIDLVATAGMHTEVVEATSSKEEFVPVPLTPQDLDRIRRHELAQPFNASTTR